MAKEKKATWEEKYVKLGELGEGGNAKVYLVERKEQYTEAKTANESVPEAEATGAAGEEEEIKRPAEKYALKILCFKNEEKRVRFLDEIRIMRENADVEGIIPILDFSEEEYWYTMPLAIPVMDYIRREKLKVQAIVKGMADLAGTLEQLHARGIAHRDIKPSNLYLYENRYCFGDFGLVEFPDNPNDFTRSDRGLGAVFTIAPEMKRDPKHADGKKADVFSMAKTLWMLLSWDEKGFDGVYNFLDKSHSLRLMERFKNIHLVEIEELLTKATDNLPENRPDIGGFKAELEKWLNTVEDFEKRQESEWLFLGRQLFGDSRADSMFWSEAATIVDILNTVGTLPVYNHMLFSDGGGLDFVYAEEAAEEGCIYIHGALGSLFVVRPERLCYQGFGRNYRWNYFLLELAPLEPVLEQYDEISYEYLVEDYPGSYVSAAYSQYGVYDYDSGEKLPKGYKVVRRYLKGKFLIVLKNGPYNQINGTYDGRHGMCSNDEFRKYISRLIAMVEKGKEAGIEEEVILDSRVLNDNPFKKEEPERAVRRAGGKNPYSFIQENAFSWCFAGFLKENGGQSDRRLQFYLEYHGREEGRLSRFWDRKQFLMCADGYIRETDGEVKAEIYYSYEREVIWEICKKCNLYVEEKCREAGYTGRILEDPFSVEIEKCGKPIHLFTKEEIRELMRNADDRRTNMLVIDEDGYARMIQDIRKSFLYPVRNESWQAGNVYVGKYSDLSDLDRTYICSLQGWLIYLQSGRTVYMDYEHHNFNEEELLEEIGRYY